MHQICEQQGILTTQEFASDFRFDPTNTSTKHISPYIMVYFVKVFAIATTFQKFTFIVRYCPFPSAFGARVFKQRKKKISRVFRTYEYQNRCAQINIYTWNDVSNAQKMTQIIGLGSQQKHKPHKAPKKKEETLLTCRNLSVKSCTD